MKKLLNKQVGDDMHVCAECAGVGARVLANECVRHGGRD